MESELTAHTQLRQQTHDLKTKSFTAAGTPRHLFPGANFTLSGHPVHDQDVKEQRQFVVLEQEIEAWNNLPEGLKAVNGEREMVIGKPITDHQSPNHQISRPSAPASP